MASSNGASRNLALCKKLSESVKENTCLESNQSSLVAVVDDNLLVWSREDCCFYAQHLLQKDAPLQTLCVTRPPLWSVQRILVNSRGTGVLLVGRRGVGVVDLPQRWGKHHTFDGGRDHITCRIEYIAERFLVCHQRVGVVAAHWHPGSPHHNHVVMLATDHYLRVYSLRSRDVPEQALAITVPRPDSVFSRHYPSEGGAAAAVKQEQEEERPGRLGTAVLGEEAVDFTIAAPIVPEGTVGDKASGDVADSGSSAAVAAAVAASSDLLWPVFVLYANGDVYHTCLTLHPHKVRSRTVSGPLVLRPPREDNYALEWCSLTWLGETGGVGGVLVLATCGGRLHHCVVMPPDPPSAQPKAGDDGGSVGLLQELSNLSMGPSPSSPSVSLFVYETVDLELSLCPDVEDAQRPLLLARDEAAPNRYLVLHSGGVHAVAVSLVDALRQLTLDGDSALPTDSDCSVEYLVCTRSLPSAAPLPVVGATLWGPDALGRHSCSSSSNTELLVLMASGGIVSVRMPPLLPALPTLPHLPLRDSKSKSASSDGESFESVIARVLSRGSSQPVLASSASQPLDPLEALDLTNRTLHTLRTEYIAPQTNAQQHILHRVRVLCDQQRALCSQLNGVQQQRQQLVLQTQRLQQLQEETRQRQDDITARLDGVVASALRQLPGLSGGERWMLKQLHSMQEQLPHLNDDLQHLHTKLHWHATNMQADSSDDTTAQSRDMKLSQNQLHSLKKSLGAESEKIGKLVSRFNGLKKNLVI